MGVSAVIVKSVEPYEDGVAWGDVGPYEIVKGVLRFSVDPTHPANDMITDLQFAPISDGVVEFEADFGLLRPRIPATKQERLLFNVVNRGMMRAVPFSRVSAEDGPLTRPDQIHPGDGFLLRHGWTVMWCGWQWDVLRGPGVAGIDAPIAQNGNGAISGPVRVGFRPQSDSPDHPLCELLVPRNLMPRFTRYPAADLEDIDAVLTIRHQPQGPAQEIDRSQWRFARDIDGSVTPSAEHVWLEGGFRAGCFYEIVYRTSMSPVVGTGLLAVRDAVSFVRHGRVAGRGPMTGISIGFGISQSGRFLRQFVYEGLNCDENGRRVFDGVFAHIAGGRRGEFNQRFGQPSTTNVEGFGHLPPFAADDPRGGLLDTQRRLGSVPKIFFTNSAWEYWRGDASLLHIDRQGFADLPESAEVRCYLISGTDHVGGTPLPSAVPIANQRNGIGANEVLRALLVCLDDWVQGVEPPTSEVPRIADGTAALRADVLAAIRRATAALGRPAVGELPQMRALDLGPDAAHGIGRYPITTGEYFTAYVAAINGDGNEVCGIRLPAIAVPLATHTGWNVSAQSAGRPGQFIDFLGSKLPFPLTREQGFQDWDCRPSIEERYNDETDYVARVQSVIQSLIQKRLVLNEDADVLVEDAVARYRRMRIPGRD